jgi:hypothetical protein
VNQPVSSREEARRRNRIGVRPVEIGVDNRAMTRKRAVTLLGLFVLGVLVVGGTATAYRAAIEHWEGDPRGTLIAAAVVGISFFISMVSLLSWVERRQAASKPGQTGDVAGRDANQPF